MKKIGMSVALFLAIQPTLTDAIPKRKAALIVGGVASVAGANGVRVWAQSSAARNDKRDNILGAVVAGGVALGVTGLLLYDRLPSSRLRYVVGRLAETETGLAYSRSLICRSTSKTFMDSEASFRRLQGFRYRVEQDRAVLDKARKDFEAEENVEGIKQCDEACQQITRSLSMIERQLLRLCKINRRLQYEQCNHPEMVAEKQTVAAKSNDTDIVFPLVAWATWTHLRGYNNQSGTNAARVIDHEYYDNGNSNEADGQDDCYDAEE